MATYRECLLGNRPDWQEESPSGSSSFVSVPVTALPCPGTSLWGFARVAIAGAMLLVAPCAFAGSFDLRLESGALAFSRNEVRIPGDGGTKFDMLDLTGKGPSPFVRVYATYDFNPGHALRLTYAPVSVDGKGRLRGDVVFRDDVFAADVPTKGIYKFNTYRLTYRRTFRDGERWPWGIGLAVLVRDAEITLQQGDKRQSKNDLGFVPLIHLYGAYRFDERVSFVMDAEGAWSPMGRAIDAALMAQYRFDSGWYAAAGYRSLEGGADNDEVYTFAWLHYVQASIGCRF